MSQQDLYGIPYHFLRVDPETVRPWPPLGAVPWYVRRNQLDMLRLNTFMIERWLETNWRDSFSASVRGLVWIPGQGAREL